MSLASPKPSLVGDDNETARYLASYIIQQLAWWSETRESYIIDAEQEPLEKTIKEFYATVK